MGRRGREADNLERRIPWVTATLVCLCALGFAWAQTEALEIDAVADTQLSAAAEFFQGHPYLAMPSILEARIDRGTAQQLAREHERRRQRLSSTPLPAGRVAREQTELDEMAQRVSLKLEGRPERTFGVRASERDPVTLLTHAFLHGSVAHLVLGMLLLGLLGRQLEAAWGSAVTLGTASAAVLGSVAIFILQQPGYSEPLIGSSGLLAGLLGAFVVRFAPAQRGVAFVPLLVLGVLALGLPPWLGHEWSIARGIGAEPPLLGGWNPSLWAVTGGFASGAAFAGLVRLLGLEGRIERPGVEREIRRGEHDVDLERALQYHRAGANDEAFRRLAAILRRDPNHEAASLAYWDVCSDLARADEAAPYLLRVVREDVRCGNTERAVHCWLDLARSELDGGAEPALLLRMATLLREAGDETAAVRALRLALGRAGDTSASSVATRVAREAAELDPETSVEAAWQALGSLDIDLEDRQALEALIERVTAYTGTHAREQPRFAPGAEYRPALIERSEPAGESAAAEERDERDAEDEPEAHDDGIALDGREREIDLVHAAPLAFDEVGLMIEAEGSRKRVRYERVDAVAVAAVEGLSGKPVIVIDLVLNWMSLTAEPLRVIRLRTDRFDPRSVVTDKRDPLEAVRVFCKRIVREADATPLPDFQSISGLPFAAFKSLSHYQRDVLLVDEDEG